MQKEPSLGFFLKILSKNVNYIAQNERKDKFCPLMYINIHCGKYTIISLKEMVLMNMPSELTVRESAIIQMLFSTGVRISELRNLRIIDLNLMERTAVIAGKDTERTVRFSEVCSILLSKHISDNHSGSEYVF